MLDLPILCPCGAKFSADFAKQRGSCILCGEVLSAGAPTEKPKVCGKCGGKVFAGMTCPECSEPYQGEAIG
jgi:hypothetical protein